jgi:hypothetical protein
VAHAVNKVTLSRSTIVFGKGGFCGYGMPIHTAPTPPKNFLGGAPSGVAVRARLCVVFLDKGMPLPAKHALIRTRTGTLSVTLLTAWITRVGR